MRRVAAGLAALAIGLTAVAGSQALAQETATGETAEQDSAERALPIELRWLAPGANAVAALTTEPAECLAPAATPERARQQEIGRALFRSPTLLGGQAARAGLSCASCHRNGRGNPDFAFVGVSGGPGTADITSSFFSSHRGDQVENPVPIPDLAGPRELLKVERAPESRALEGFIRGLIVEEFDGPEPPVAALDALAAYVRGLGPEACPAEAVRAIRVSDVMAGAGRSVELAAPVYAGGDAETADLLLASARSDLGRIDERYSARLALVVSSIRLASAQQALRDGESPSAVSEFLFDVRTDLESLALDLEADEDASLFNPDMLSRVLAEPR